MSYDIVFKVKVADTDKYVTVGDCSANITWNVRKIIELSTGLPWLNEENNGYCVDIMPAIQKGLNELRAHPEKYKQYEAENGWGTVSGTARFFAQILKDWEEYTRWEDPEVIAKTTFWVVQRCKIIVSLAETPSRKDKWCAVNA